MPVPRECHDAAVGRETRLAADQLRPTEPSVEASAAVLPGRRG